MSIIQEAQVTSAPVQASWGDIEERVFLFVKLATMDEKAASLVLKDVYLNAITDPKAMREELTAEESMLKLAVSMLQDRNVRWSTPGLIAKRAKGIAKSVEKRLMESLRLLPLEYRVVFILHDMLGIGRNSLCNIMSMSAEQLGRKVTHSRLMLLRFSKESPAN